MADTMFADVSEFQSPVNDTYPYRFISIRSNDGTYRDGKFAQNLAWCKAAADSGRIDGFIVYFVYEPNWRDTVATFLNMVGADPHPKMAVMIDVESWGGRLTGDHSAKINATREAVIKWLGAHMTARQRAVGLHRRRVIGYGNAGDLNSLWPKRGDVKLIVANYSYNPSFPNKIAHQFGDNYPVAPFGRCDINSADGFTPARFAKALGLPVKAAPKHDPHAVMKADLDKQFAVVRDYIMAKYGK